MLTENGSPHDLMRQALARAGAAADAKAVAEAGVDTLRQVTAQLAPVIGERGVHALYARSLHLTRAAFPWLAADPGTRQPDATYANLRVCLEQRDRAEAAAASHALLVTFTELLATLIGQSLTERLLRPVWEAPRRSSTGDPA